MRVINHSNKLQNLNKKQIMTNANTIIEVAGDYATFGVKIDYKTKLTDIFDSLDAIAFVMAVEQRCRCEISDEQMEKFVTIADVIACVNENNGVAAIEGVCPICRTPINDFTPSEGCWICPN